MKNKAYAAICLMLSVSLLLTGCSFHFNPADQGKFVKTAIQYGDPSVDVDPDYLPDEVDWDDYSGMVDYLDIEYQRPDVQAIVADIDAVTAMLADGAEKDDVLNALVDVEDAYYDFSTMNSVAYIAYCKDLSDSYYEDEYNYLEKENATIQAAMERFYVAAAASDYKDYLEENYYGAGYLDFYLSHQIYSNEEFVTLAQQETDLETAYMNLQDSPTITIDGRERDFAEVMEEYDGDYDMLYNTIYPAYFEKYNAQAGEIFVQLVKVRKQMAKVAGYDSYQDFMYEYYYNRDYTPEMARTYIAELCDALVPISRQMYSSVGYDTYRDMDMEAVKDALATTLYFMDDDYYEFFLVMQKFNLWDCSESASKMPGSYETYLYSYHEPFVYISPTGTEADYLTLAHEFGHFVDGMWNWGRNTDIDICEIFSQGLEYLSLCYSELPESTLTRMRKLKLMDTYEVFLYQAAYADFEDRVYQLADDQLTLEKINAVYQQVMQDYGQYMDGLDWYNQMAWIDITHFFIAPCYVISYCTSADVALQIYQLELEQDYEGLYAYWNLIDYAVDYSFLGLLDYCEMESPFDPGRATELARQFSDWISD